MSNSDMSVAIVDDEPGILAAMAQLLDSPGVTAAAQQANRGQPGTAEKTIQVHRARVMEKLQVESVAELVHLAQHLGIPGRQ